jgi:hypothetical protein
VRDNIEADGFDERELARHSRDLRRH